MHQYTISNRLRITTLVMIAVGVICLGLTWMGDDEHHTRFWSNVLHNASYFTGISVMAGFFTAVCITAWAGWYTLFKRVWESIATFLLQGLILMAIVGLGVYMGFNHLYHWADPAVLDPASEHYDTLLAGKSGFLNKNVYLFGTLIIVGVWWFFANRLRTLSIDEDNHGGDEGFSHHRKMRFWAAIFLPIVGFTSAAMVWLWIMSVDAHWYSTLFAWYSGASWFVAMICVTILIIYYLKGKGYLEQVSNEHLHDLGKFLFAFSIFWAYLWFSQYMLIWYGNIGEETEYFRTRFDHYPVMFYVNLFINFILPFFVLMRNDTKRKFGSLGFIAMIVFVGHWLDFFLMIKPGVRHTALHGAHDLGFQMGYTIPGFLEIGTMVGFLGLFLFTIFTALGRAALVPKNDPYLQESIHHHV